jgi:hypothetical protein
MKKADNLGMLLLGVWLLASGAAQMFRISFDGLGAILAALAMAAGALILFGK